MQATIHHKTERAVTYNLPYYFKHNGAHFAWIAPNESICIDYHSMRISKNDGYCEASTELELFSDKIVEITKEDWEWVYSEWDRFQKGYVQEKVINNNKYYVGDEG